MALLVQKFGGSSVSTIEKIRVIAQKVLTTISQGNQVIVVISAMGDTTDYLLSLAAHIDIEEHNSREMDVLLSSGEQISASLMSLAINQLGGKARSFLGYQIPILTNNNYGNANIDHIDKDILLDCLDKNIIPVIAGYQGVTHDQMNITTLGRGGSDTTATAIAGFIGADACHIFTDVDGVYTVDPRIVPTAKKLDKIDYTSMELMAINGAQVLKGQAVEIAKQYNLNLHVLSSFSGQPGTIIIPDEYNLYNLSGNNNRYIVGLAIKNNINSKLHIAELSIIGHNLNVDSSIENAMSECMAANDIVVFDKNLSNTKVSVLIDEKYIELAANLLAVQFGLTEDEKRLAV